MTEPVTSTSTPTATRQAGPPAQPPAEPVRIRPYRPLDHGACRELWAELTRTRGARYDDPRGGGADPGAAFEEYLTRLDLAGMWVADHPEEGVVGLVGLVLGASRGGEVEPVVVAERMHHRGIGRALLRYVADEARRRALTQLSISPDSRNVDAIRSLHAAGYAVLSSVTLTLDLSPRGQHWQDGLDLHGRRFRY
jgi:GNAT superfamily N-acetyltransferase